MLSTLIKIKTFLCKDKMVSGAKSLDKNYIKFNK